MQLFEEYVVTTCTLKAEIQKVFSFKCSCAMFPFTYLTYYCSQNNVYFLVVKTIATELEFFPTLHTVCEVVVLFFIVCLGQE